MNYAKQNETYNYDGAGNRLSKNDTDTTPDASFDMRNQLNSDAKYVFGYDLNGNMISRKPKSDESKLTEYHYDAENRLEFLVSNESAGGHWARYAYDPMGRRVMMWNGSGGSESRFMWFAYDGDDVTAEFAGKYYLGAAEGEELAVAAHYLQGPGVDEHLVWWGRDYRAANWKDLNLEPILPLEDGLGSTVDLIGYADAAATEQSVVGKYIYDSFGNQMSICGAAARMYRYRFTGREYDDYGPASEPGLFGLSYHRARYYDSKLGIFTSEDSNFDTNLYFYALNNPTIFRDPDGKQVANDPMAGAVRAMAISHAREIGGEEYAKEIENAYMAGDKAAVLGGTIVIGAAIGITAGPEIAVAVRGSKIVRFLGGVVTATKRYFNRTEILQVQRAIVKCIMARKGLKDAVDKREISAEAYEAALKAIEEKLISLTEQLEKLGGAIK